MKAVPFYIVPVLWLVSFFFSIPLAEPHEVARLLSLAAGVAALGVVLADPANRAATLPVAGLPVLVLAFLAWCGLTFFWSVSPFVTVIAWGTLSLLPLWFLIFALMPVTPRQIMLVLRLAVGAGGALALWAFAQYFVFTEFLNEYGTIAYPFADPNNYAALLNVGIFVALGLMLHADRAGERYAQGAASVLMMAAMVMIGSRAGMVFAFAGLAVFALMTRSAARSPAKMIVVLMAAGCVALAVTALFNAERITSIMRVGHLFTDGGSLSARLMLWSATLDLIGQRVWGGAGLGTFFLLYPAVRDPAEIYSAGLMTHMDPLQFWAEAGLPAAILLYAILLAVALRFLAFLKAAPSGARRSLLPVALFCALLTLAFHMHVSFHLYVAAVLVMAGAVLGVLMRLLPPVRPLASVSAGTPAMLFLIVMCAYLAVFQSCLFSEMHTRQAVAALDKGDMQTFGDKVNQASREGFDLNPRPYVLAASVPLGLLQTSPHLPPTEKQALFAQADDLLDRGLARSPFNAGAYFSKALLYGAAGRGDEAVRFLEKTLETDPRHPQARALLAHPR